jgi:predicted nuclease with TOPRIM domain
LTIQTYLRLKSDVETAKEQAQKAAGAREVLLKTLRSDFGCNSIEEANALSQRLQNELATLETKLEQAIDEYQRKWKSHE